MPPWVMHRWYDLGYLTCFWTFGTLFSLRTRGGQNVPDGPVLMVANHQSFMDPVLVGLASSRRRVSFLARETLFKNKTAAALMRSLDAVPIDHRGFSREGLQATLDFLHRGKVVCVFAEGERTHTGEVEPFKPGISLLMKRVKAPIVPVGIAGAYDAWPRTRKVPRLAPVFAPPSSATIAVSVGKPIAPETYAGMPRDAMLEDLRQRVETERVKADHLRRQRRD
jgi:1-acyl-sn-glycerol-3-phosphate acyltransferase